MHDMLRVLIWYRRILVLGTVLLVGGLVAASLHGHGDQAAESAAVTPTSASNSTPPPSTSSQTGTPPPGRVVIAAGLKLAQSRVSAGQSLAAWVTLGNTGGRPVALTGIVIAGRPPGGTNAGGPFDDFGGTGDITLAPGQTITVRKTRTFTAADPTGTWYAFVTYRDTEEDWHDDTADVYFTVEPVAPASPAMAGPNR